MIDDSEISILETDEVDELIAAREAVRGDDPAATHVERTELCPENRFYEHGRSRGFVARRAGVPLGRVVASLDEHLPEKDVGHFGFFECVDDVAVATALLAAAETWLHAQGRRRVHGPVQLSVYRSYRWQVEGFARSPFPGEPRNPAHYPRLAVAAGYAHHAGWASWEIPPLAVWLWRTSMLRHHFRLRRLRREGYRVVPAPLDEPEQQLRTLHPVLMECFRANYGCSAISVEEYVQIERRLAHLQGVVAAFLLDPKDELAGFTFGYHDGSWAVFHTFGILERDRGKGLAYLLFADALSTIRREGVSSVVGALVKDGPSHYSKLGKLTRRYAVFCKELG